MLTSSNSTVWFLTSMFLTSLLFFALVHLRGKWLALSSLACLAVSGAFTYCPILLTWSLDTVPLTAVIMLSGFYFGKIDLEQMKLWRKGVLLVAIAAVYLVSLNAGDGINLSIRVYGTRGLVSYAWALPQLFFGSACFALFFAMIPQGKVLAPLASIGRHSVTYLCEHLFALLIAGKVLSFFEMSEFALALLTFLLAVGAGALTSVIFDRLKGRIALLRYL